MATPHVFPTFCHISEFGERGYKRLDTMISMSLPLTLWAPSMKIASRYSTEQTNPPVLLRLLDLGVVRIAGRDDWINNGPKRRLRAKMWEGAEWTQEDSAIQRIAAADRNLQPENSRRVQEVADEDGYDHADEFLQARPDAMQEIYRLIE